MHNSTNFLDFPNLPIFQPKCDSSNNQECVNYSSSQQSSSNYVQSFLPTHVQSTMRNVVPQARRWSCGDSQHAAVETPALYYHNLGFILHNHIQMSNHRYFDFEFSLNDPPISPYDIAPSHQVPPFENQESQDHQQFPSDFYGNSVIQNNPYYGNTERSISAPNVESIDQRNPDVLHGSSQNCTGRRRFRTNFTEHQSSFLECSFKESHYPDHKAKKTMADYLNIPEDRITVWFQNRRAKWRRKEHRQRDRSRNTKLISSSNTFDYSSYPLRSQHAPLFPEHSSTINESNQQIPDQFLVKKDDHSSQFQEPPH